MCFVERLYKERTFALCGCGHRAFGLVRVGSRRKWWRRLDSSGRSGEGEGTSRIPSLSLCPSLCLLAAAYSRCRAGLYAVGTAPSLPARRSASKTAPRPGLRGAPRLPAPLRVALGW